MVVYNPEKDSTNYKKALSKISNLGFTGIAKKPFAEKLLDINFSDYKLNAVKKTRASWDVWYGKDLGNEKTQ